MSSAAAHWSPAVTELVQLVRTRWRENCFVGTKKRFQLCFETRGPRQMCGTCCFAPNICSSLPWWLGFIPGLPRIGNSAGFFILSQLPAWAKKAPRTCRKRGAGPLSDRKSQSIVRLSKDQGGSSVLLDTPVVNCLFNRRQYYFVIGPIPVLYAQAAD